MQRERASVKGSSAHPLAKRYERAYLQPMTNPPNAPPAADDPTRGFIATTRMVADASGPDGLTIGEIVDRLDERAFGLLILIFAIPCLVPGLPGAQIIAIPIFLLGLQMMLGRQEPWLPGWFLRARVKKGWLDGIAGFCEKRLKWTETVAKPRLTFLASGLAERLVGLVIALAAVTIMLPITNTIPSLAITVMAVGLLQRDGVFTIGGALIAFAWVSLLAGLIMALVYGAAFAVEFVREHLPWLAQIIATA
jgi:hypothetical protein